MNRRILRRDAELVAERIAVVIVALGLDLIEKAQVLSLALPGDGEIAHRVHAHRRTLLRIGGHRVDQELVPSGPHTLDGRLGHAVLVHVGEEGRCVVADGRDRDRAGRFRDFRYHATYVLVSPLDVQDIA